MLRVLVLLILINININTLSDLNQPRALTNLASYEVQQDIDFMVGYKCLDIINIPSDCNKYKFIRFWGEPLYYILLAQFQGDRSQAIKHYERMKNSAEVYSKMNDLEFIEVKINWSIN